MPAFHPDLPQRPFFVGVIGPRHRGKSVFLYNLMSNAPGMYGNSYKKSNMIFYSPTADQDKTMKSLKLENVFAPPTTVDAIVSSIKTQQKALKEAGEQTGVLLVLDDATNIRDGWIPIIDLGYTGRHLDIDGMYVAHKMSSIPRGLRTQTQQWILYEPHEESERQWIMEMFSRRTTRQLWENALLRSWREPYQFVYIDFEEKELERVYRKGFHDPLFTPEEMAFMSGDVVFNPFDGKRMGVTYTQRDNDDKDDTAEEAMSSAPRKRKDPAEEASRPTKRRKQK